LQLTLDRKPRYSLTVFDLKRLEYTKVLRIAGKNCRHEYSRRKFLSLKPSIDRETVLACFTRLQELKKLTDSGVNIRFDGYRDVLDMLKRAAVPGSMLSAEELSGIRENIAAAASLKEQLAGLKEEAPLLGTMVRAIHVPLDVRDEIDRAIDEHGNVRDDASPKLGEIIAEINALRRAVESVLDGYLNAPDSKQFLQDRHITVKDDRYVIPVKQSFKGRVPGVAHAYSGSEKTVFIEPFQVVEKNNEIRLLEREREQELRKILTALTKTVRRKRADLEAVQEFLAEFDVLLAKGAFAEGFGCTIPEFSNVRELVIEEGAHPLLRESAVPVSFSSGSDTRATVITGPNTGGKTVTLKMIGLFVLLAQSGVPVPAKRMRTCFFTSVYSDMGDEGSIEQSLSTFSGHVKNIKKIIAGADGESLVLIDELGAGTDPLEGGALGAAVLDYLVSHNILTVVTTHFSFIKMYAIEKSTVQVASVEFDARTCRPTYRLIMGIPGRSNALEIARHLGLKREVVDKTAEYLSEEDRSRDTLLRRLTSLEMELRKREDILRRKEGVLAETIEKNREQSRKLVERERFISAEYEKKLAGLLAEYRKRSSRQLNESFMIL
jgi:DNA mismatch repair protein MutS2